MRARQNTRRLIAAVFFAGFGAISAYGQTFAATGTTNVKVTVAAEASIRIDTADTLLTSPDTLFSDYTGTTNFTYKIRTSQAESSTGSITLKIQTDFSPTGGPSVASPPSAGDTLKYTCTVASPGTACASAQTSSTTTATSVASFANDAHSAKAGNTGSVGWTLTNDPVYKTGEYTAVALFTISAS